MRSAWHRFPPLLILFLSAACTPRGPRVEIGGYAFTHDGREYRLESITPSYTEGYNILSRREGERLEFKGLDKEQDGRLDEVLIGTMSLSDAQAAYEEGIREGERRGYLKKRTFAREYKSSDMLFDYVLATYILATGEVYNRFTVVNRQAFQDVSVLMDLEADGRIDRIESGFNTLMEYQKLYQGMLERGVKAYKIIVKDKRYIVVL